MTFASPSDAFAADPLAWRLELQEALSQPALRRFEGDETVESGLADRAAYRLAAALGQCRLFGVDLSGEDGSLRPAVGLAAARQWGDYLNAWIADARRLGERWDQALDETEAADLAIDLLVARMESWAVFLAVDEAYQESLEGDAPERAGFADILDSDLARLQEFDDELRSNVDLLSLAADTHLLENWRQLLGDTYRQALPWWLDRTLEDAGKRVGEDSLAWQPRSDRTYNLLIEKWIPVLRMDGKPDRVGIREALTGAGSIREIAASNPLDNVALLRFLLAVLQWCKPTPTEEELAVLRANRSNGIPDAWLTNLGTAEKPIEAFNLLGQGQRFYQDDRTPSNDRPIGDLLFEFPTETKIAHLRHVRDKQYGLCPGCCALGIIRLCAWANAYGGGRYTSAVNGPTPAYAITRGSTLLRTLLLNRPRMTTLNREPPWICADPPKENDLDIVTVFAWRSRRIWLGDPDGEGLCSYCGLTAKLIRQHAFTGDWKPPFPGEEKRFWAKDPHLILVEKAQAAEDTDTSEAQEGVSTTPAQSGRHGAAKYTTLGFPSPGSKVAAHARFWRRALSAALAPSSAADSDSAAIIVTGPAANKGLYQDASSLRLPRGFQCGTMEVMSKAVEGREGLIHVLRSSTPNPQRQHPNRRAALDALSASLETQLHHEIVALQEAYDLKEALLPIVQDVVRATTPGSPLRRREAIRNAALALDEALRNAASQSKKSASGHTSRSDQIQAPKGKRVAKKKRTER